MGGHADPEIPSAPQERKALNGVIAGIAALPAAVRKSNKVRGLAGALRVRPLTGAAASLHLPRWAAELAGGLSEKTCRTLEAAQVLIVCGAILQDGQIDDGDSEVAPWDIVGLLVGARARLTEVFRAGDPFWRGYASLLRRQAASARWELDRRGMPLRLDAKLLRALGDKAALLRWPALAVGRLSGGRSTAARVDGLFGRLFIVHQLLDDLADVAEDSARGQQNALLAALGPGPSRGELAEELRRARAVRRVCSLARRELSSILRSVPERSGIGRHCRELGAVCEAHEQRSSGTAGLRILGGILDRLMRGPR